MRRLPSPVARFSRHDTVATWTEHGVDRGRADGHRDLRAQALAVATLIGTACRASGAVHRHADRPTRVQRALTSGATSLRRVQLHRKVVANRRVAKSCG